eukprot:jgi/Galph1/5777/GphlegSOOS_G4504.1
MESLNDSVWLSLDVERRSDIRRKDKSLFATAENAIDRRTRLLLFKLLSTGMLRNIYGCVSTGKEANVYSAVAGDSLCSIQNANSSNVLPVSLEKVAGRILAVKVFKTVSLSFRDRDRYISGDFRFQSGYKKTSSRDMVILWTEKEFRNLRRLIKSGIPVPVPYYMKKNILVMEFIGTDHQGAPLLKDVVLSVAEWLHLYLKVCRIMRSMYRDAGLVHGDLSEYNLLYHMGQLLVIDVSQAVERDHPNIASFLCRDCKNICLFFKKKIVQDEEHIHWELVEEELPLLTFSPLELFHYILLDERKLEKEDPQEVLGILQDLHLDIGEKEWSNINGHGDQDNTESIQTYITSIDSSNHKEMNDIQNCDDSDASLFSFHSNEDAEKTVHCPSSE